MTLCMAAIFVAVCCRPLCEPQRVEQTGARLIALEAAFNTLLDMLRPLLGPEAATSKVNGAACMGSSPLGRTRSSLRGQLDLPALSARLVTTDLRTLRVSLSVEAGWGPAAALVMRCPLTDFSIVVTGCLASAVPTELLGPSSGPPCSAHGASQTLQQWRKNSFATLMEEAAVCGHARPSQRCQDDEASLSAASLSTASTMRPGGPCGATDEATWAKSLAGITAITSRKKAPLEAFRTAPAGVVAPVVPTKASAGEAVLLLQLLPDSARIFPGPQPPSRARQGAVPWWRFDLKSGMGDPITGSEDFGVLHAPWDLRKLCHPQMSGSDGCPGREGSNATLPMQLALLFNAPAERCLLRNRLQEARLLPESERDELPSLGPGLEEFHILEVS